MDKLYTGDIPSDYTYAVFSNDYVTLYNQPNAINTDLPYYRIFTNYNGFYYTQGVTHFPQYNTTEFQKIETSDNWLYRQDIDKIFSVCFFIIVLFIFVFNIATSVFKKGGVFGGLL